jgi:hypothetical protein
LGRPVDGVAGKAKYRIMSHYLAAVGHWCSSFLKVSLRLIRLIVCSLLVTS